MNSEIEHIAPGIWKIRFGEPEKLTPLTYRQTPIRKDALAELPEAAEPPFDVRRIEARPTARGLTVNLPARDDEDFYGAGLQLKSFRQTGLRKALRVNSDPVADTGDSHAPVPFYLSTNGYAVYVDTLRNAAFHFASHPLHGQGAEKVHRSTVDTSPAALYSQRERSRQVEIDLPTARGVDLYVFAGPAMVEALQRYVLFSGGGTMPPMWGLGVWYRCYSKFDQEKALDLARCLRERGMPCDVYGMEPGWQSNAYACSFKWSPERFPDPKAFIDQIGEMGLRINLWEHAFTHSTSPIYESMRPHAGSHEVFGGLVPDFTDDRAVAIFGEYHDTEFLQQGVSGFKLDECDGSDFIGFPWSFPDHAEFPGGLDGEQYHHLFGTIYARVMENLFRRHGRRTYGSVRNLGSLSSTLPFVLYSDLYDHRDFIRGILTAGLSGLLWTPEVRDAENMEDLIRRLQTVVLSPQALINAWYIPLPPWEQTAKEPNERGERMPGWEQYEDTVREILRLRMRLAPYLYTAFAHYHFTGRPPFRPLVLDYPDDPAVRAVDDQFMIGDSLMAAPVVAGQAGRSIVLPPGIWHDFFTGEAIHGGRIIRIETDLARIPLFVRGDAIVLLAEPVDHIQADTVFLIVPHLFGDPAVGAELFEDDGETFGFESGDCGWVDVAPNGDVTRRGQYNGLPRYEFALPKRVAARKN